MRRSWHVYVTSLIVAGCAGATKGEILPPAPLSSAMIHRSRDEVFESAVRYLADKNLTIETAERRRGIVASAPFVLTDIQRAQWLECAEPVGGPGGTGPVTAQAVIDVLMHPAADSTKVQVQMRVAVTHGSVHLRCHSTGFFESDILNAIARPTPQGAGDK